VALNPEQEWAWIAQLEEIGVTEAKSLRDRGEISPDYVHLTSRWISEKEREAKIRAEAVQSEQTELMKRNSAAAERQAKAAERANTRANVAILVAVVSLIVSICFSIVTLFKH